LLPRFEHLFQALDFIGMVAVEAVSLKPIARKAKQFDLGWILADKQLPAACADGQRRPGIAATGGRLPLPENRFGSF
jgi:hypothetical protein